MSTQTTKIAITFPTTLVYRFREKANTEYGFDVPEMVRKLMADYIDDDPRDKVWSITPQQEAAYMRDDVEAEKLLAEGKIAAATSVEELRTQTEEENAE
jgi:hypothetical protein